MLSVPIPRQAQPNSTYNIKYYPLDFVLPVINITFALTNGPRTTVGEIKEKVRANVLEQYLEEGEQLTLDDVQPPIICIVKDCKIEMMARSDFELGLLDKGFKLVAIEREVHSHDTSNLVPIQLMITQQRSSYMIFKS